MAGKAGSGPQNRSDSLGASVTTHSTSPKPQTSDRGLGATVSSGTGSSGKVSQPAPKLRGTSGGSGSG